MIPSIPQRLCKKCSILYPFTPEFWHKDKKGKDGLSSTCKECKKVKSRNWHHENQEFANHRSHEYYHSHKEERREYINENADKIAQQKREWRHNNPDLVAAQKRRSANRHQSKINAYHREWYKRNRKRIIENLTPEHRRKANANSRAWAKANPDKVRNNTHLRRARMAGNGGEGYTKADHDLQLRSQKGLCWWCGKPMGNDVTQDHIVSIKLGGQHSPRNIVLAHKSCNCSKQEKLPQDWIGRLF